jgi:ABC-type multidrug transport system fused ATPase/permease subunit
VVNGVFKGTEAVLTGVAGEALTANVRQELMKGILYKQLSWFDSEDKAPGCLTNVMAEDMSALNGMTTETLSTAGGALLCLSASIITSFYFEPSTAIWSLICSPILLIGVFGMNKL